MSKQYELARVDESREGILIQVLDEASVPDHKLHPKRSIYAVVGALIALLAFATYYVCRARLDEVEKKDPLTYARWQAFKDAWRLRARG